MVGFLFPNYCPLMWANISLQNKNQYVADPLSGPLFCSFSCVFSLTHTNGLKLRILETSNVKVKFLGEIGGWKIFLAAPCPCGSLSLENIVIFCHECYYLLNVLLKNSMIEKFTNHQWAASWLCFHKWNTRM